MIDEQWRKPKTEESEEIIFDEQGRVLPHGANQVDYRSHWFILTINQYGEYALCVKHGIGEERIKLGYYTNTYAKGLAEMTSDQRFLLFWQMFDIKHKAECAAKQSEAGRYELAFVENRLKKRKMPKQASVKVWIEPKITREVGL